MLLQLERAKVGLHCAVGIKGVFRDAGRKVGRLLIVEKSYKVPSVMGKAPPLNAVDKSCLSNSVYISDVVDNVIEKVLEGGGDVELVADGLLKDYSRIALITS